MAVELLLVLGQDLPQRAVEAAIARLSLDTAASVEWLRLDGVDALEAHVDALESGTALVLTPVESGPKLVKEHGFHRVAEEPIVPKQVPVCWVVSRQVRGDVSPGVVLVGPPRTTTWLGKATVYDIHPVGNTSSSLGIFLLTGNGSSSGDPHSVPANHEAWSFGSAPWPTSFQLNGRPAASQITSGGFDVWPNLPFGATSAATGAWSPTWQVSKNGVSLPLWFQIQPTSSGTTQRWWAESSVLVANNRVKFGVYDTHVFQQISGTPSSSALQVDLAPAGSFSVP